MSPIRALSAAALLVCALAGPARAGSIIWSGSITQSTQDGTGPAVNNPGLNNILDFQAYSATLTFAGSISAPGVYNSLSNVSLTFDDASAGANESAFGSVFLTITANGSFDDISVLGCLTTGSFGCFSGNQLDANFEIPAAGLNSQSVTATGLDQPHPLDLFEDDGGTEIQGTITGYSYVADAAVPEPSSLGLFCLATLLIAGRAMRRRTSKSEINAEITNE